MLTWSPNGAKNIWKSWGVSRSSQQSLAGWYPQFIMQRTRKMYNKHCFFAQGVENMKRTGRCSWLLVSARPAAWPRLEIETGVLRVHIPDPIRCLLRYKIRGDMASARGDIKIAILCISGVGAARSRVMSTLTISYFFYRHALSSKVTPIASGIKMQNRLFSFIFIFWVLMDLVSMLE